MIINYYCVGTFSVTRGYSTGDSGGNVTFSHV